VGECNLFDVVSPGPITEGETAYVDLKAIYNNGKICHMIMIDSISLENKLLV